MSSQSWTRSRHTPDLTAETAARALIDNVFTVFGPPSIILSDRGKAFLGDTIKELCTIYHIKKENTSAFHPQANSISERSHRTIDNHMATLLTRFAKENQSDWDQYLQIAAYSMRVSEQKLRAQFTQPHTQYKGAQSQRN